MTPIKWFLSFLKKYTVWMVSGLVLVTVSAGLSAVFPKIRGIIVDEIIGKGMTEKLIPVIALQLGLVVLAGLVRFTYQIMFEKASQGVLYDMRDKVYRKLLDEDFQFYSKKRTGDLMSRQTGDMDAVRHFVSYVIYGIWIHVLYFLFALTMFFTVNVKLALLCLLGILPLTAITTYFQSKQIHPAFKRIRNQFSALNAFVQENVSGNRVVRAFAKEDFETEKFNKHNDGYRDAQIAASGVWMRYIPIFEILAYSLDAILLIYGGYLVIQGEMSIGDLVVANGYMWMLNGPIRMAGWLVNDVGNFSTSIEKIYNTYMEEPKVKTPVSGVVKKRLEGAVEFRNVSYHVDDEDIVQDISFSVKPGQTVGIIGSTGSGKSTIMNLLCRFYDATTGQVLVDGVDVRDMDLHNLRDNIGMAMQDVFLFSDTVEGNIAYSRPDCPFEDVKKAAIMADANHFIKNMPEGYDTIVGERGVGLSGGQKQRISLARALLKDPSILILDDTTSAVDMETESYIQKQLKSINHECTIFIIAYRISSIKDADLILVLDNGHIIEHGTHDSLVAQNGYYASAFRNQYGEIPEEILNEKGGN